MRHRASGFRNRPTRPWWPNVVVAAMVVALPDMVIAQSWESLSNPRFEVPITHSPDVVLRGVTKVSVLEFGGHRQCGLELSERLAIAIRESGKFELIDRSNISAILQEQGLQSSGAFNQAQAIKLGELVGPAAIFSGKVTRCSVENSPLLNGGQYKDSRGFEHTKYVRRTTAHITASVSLIDLTTGKVYAGNLLDVSQPIENEAFDASPEAPSADAALTRMYQQAVWEVKKMILPWHESVKLTVYDDRKCGLAKSAAQLKRGDFTGAAEGLREALRRSCDAPNDKKLLAKAHYNLGIALAYSSQPDSGLKELQTSADLRDSDIANKAIQAVRVMVALDQKRRTKEVASAELGAAADAAAEKAAAGLLTNKDVIEMVKAKLSDAIVVGKIKSSLCKFDTTPRALIALKEAGASDNVVVALTETADAKCR
jgi:hypothetical protein